MDLETISHYRLLGKLGSGGMGVVYAAEDMKLGRKVALKFLTAEYSRDAVALHRFEREARTASALNHPNICTIYEIDEAEGYRFMAMELLKGMTLRDRIAHEALKSDELLDYAIQIVNGLEAAHSEDIIHRDIKPANIFVTTHGYVKLLDFGLAKLAVDPHGMSDTVVVDATAATAVAVEQLTTPGAAVGTVAYMSPEQALGEGLDARTDLFSFGAVLYQMATGRQAFTGNTSAGTVDAILHKIPPPAARINPSIPPELQSIINKALEKDRKLRYQTATDLRCDLQRLKRDSQASSHKFVITDDGSVSTETIAAPAPGLTPIPVPASTPSVAPPPPPLPSPPSSATQAGGKKGFLASAAACAAILLGVAVAFWWQTTHRAPPASYLNIKANPGAQVLVDGKASGTVTSDGTVAINVPPGEHAVQLTLPGYEPYSSSITVSPGEQERVVAAMNALPPPPPKPVETGALTVETNVAGADILVDGQLKGFTERANQPLKMELKPGSYKVQLKKAGYKDSAEQQADIAAKENNQLNFSLTVSDNPAAVPAATYLAIKSHPGAEIRIDGEVSGTVDNNGTFPEKVSPGSHTVQVSLSGYEPYSSSVTAKASAKTFLVAELKPIAPTASFSASQSKITEGQMVTLKWSSQNATDVHIEPGMGDVALSGTHDVSPMQTTTYVLTAKGFGGSTTSKALVTVEPKTSEADVQAIRETLARFKGAYDSMDTKAIRQEWPSLSQTQADAMRTTFGGLTSLQLNDDCNGAPAISGDTAQWTCSETITYVIKGQNAIPPVHNTINYHFKKSGRRWLVDRREAAGNSSG